MVVVIAIGDLHLKKDAPTMSDLVIHKLTEQIEKIKPDIVVFLGDILDTHEKIDMKTQNKAVKFMKHIASLGILTVVIIGKHERPDGNNFLTEDSSFYCLKGYPNIHVADRVLSFKWETEGVKEKIRFVFVPYVSPGSFHEALDTLTDKVMDDRPAVIFCHQEFKGANMGGYNSQIGDEWPETNPLVISGNCHVMTPLQKNLIYVGTPYQQSYSDTSRKGIFLMEFRHDKAPVVNFFELEMRKKKIIKLKPAEVDGFVPPPNCDVKVDICGTSSEIAEIRSKGTIATMRSKGIHVSLSTEQSVDPSNPDNKPFKELLQEMIKNDPDEVAVFNEIFPGSLNYTEKSILGKPDLTRISNLQELLETVQKVGSSSAPVANPINPLLQLERPVVGSLLGENLEIKAPIGQAFEPKPNPLQTLLNAQPPPRQTQNAGLLQSIMSEAIKK